MVGRVGGCTKKSQSEASCARVIGTRHKTKVNLFAAFGLVRVAEVPYDFLYQPFVVCWLYAVCLVGTKAVCLVGINTVNLVGANAVCNVSRLCMRDW